ncbi:hypothetical protein DE146DRAFT_752574 [Phaeosphaeria sp. MPI-PUGE-AT-0046c]|nr:hypothetical protein DE146DRAFT_752574 [Phaeosphaeria sp. MPI-PUGE-AT-0046c]
MDYQNLLIALIILVCLLIVLFAVYVLNHHVKRSQKTPAQKEDADIEANLSSDQTSRSGVIQEHSSDDSRLSRLTIVAPSIELLPEIKTNKDRAEDWLDRRDSRATDGDLELESLSLREAKLDTDTDSKCRDGQDDGGASDERRTDVFR